jgi:hypothetical protein
MICDHAKPADFDRWEAHAKTLDAYSIRYIIKDCQQAAANMKGWNPNREGYYIDQSCTYAMELSRRNRDLLAALRHR